VFLHHDAAAIDVPVNLDAAQVGAQVVQGARSRRYTRWRPLLAAASRAVLPPAEKSRCEWPASDV
jgi:hypothetical protein